jgi:hypothetical protein
VAEREQDDADHGLDDRHRRNDQGQQGRHRRHDELLVLGRVGNYDSSGNLIGEDDAPANGLWGFDLNATAPTPPPATTTTPAPKTTPAAAVRPVIGSPVTRSARPTAGRQFTVTFA